MEVDQLVRETLRRIGYTDVAYGTSADACRVEVLLSSQSADIAQGVDKALEARAGDLEDDLDTGARGGEPFDHPVLLGRERAPHVERGGDVMAVGHADAGAEPSP